MNLRAPHPLPPRRPTPKPAAFTLTELLVVIAIAGVLMAILIPMLVRMREAARIAQGVSNLRQIGMALHLYAASNKDRLPYSFYDGKYDYSLALSGYLDGTRTTYGSDSSQNHHNSVFKDPSAKISGGSLHFSAYGAFMPSVNSTTTATRPQVRLASIGRPTQLIIIADASQDASGQSGASLSTSKLSADFTGDLSAPVPPGPNVDGSQNGQIRWRLRNNTAAKFLFVDGHVEVLSIGQLKYCNIIAD